MNTDNDQNSSAEKIRVKKMFSMNIKGKEKLENKVNCLKKSKTLKQFRRDRFGSTIKKGGKHKICFMDKIQGERHKLCDVINITLINANDSHLSIENVEKIISNSLNVNNDNNNNSQINKDESKEKKQEIVKKPIKKSLNTKSNDDENCSCACNIF